MKIKRTCRRCGYVWYGSVAGGIAAGILKSFFAGLVTAKTGGSYIDHAKFRDELRLCPNCGASDSYKTEYEKEEPKPAPKKIPNEEHAIRPYIYSPPGYIPKKVPEKAAKPEQKKTEPAPEKKPELTWYETLLGWLIIIAIIVAVVFIFRCSCSGPSETPSEKPPETNEKKQTQKESGSNSFEYKGKTVKIGTQIWMAENLNYDIAGSKCYENKPENCTKYGRLYNWAAAMKACPKGWHLPSNDEWNILFKFVEPKASEKNNSIGKKLKAKTGWPDHPKAGNGTDNYGFAALPGGIGNSDGSFLAGGMSGGGGYWWSSTTSKRNAANAYSQNTFFSINSMSSYDGNEKSSSFSVRCIKD